MNSVTALVTSHNAEGAVATSVKSIVTGSDIHVDSMGPDHWNMHGVRFVTKLVVDRSLKGRCCGPMLG
jgi:hypothetical protein